MRPFKQLRLAWTEVASIEVDDRAAVITAIDGRSQRIDLIDVLNPKAVREAISAARTQLDASRHAASASIESTATNT